MTTLKEVQDSEKEMLIPKKRVKDIAPADEEKFQRREQEEREQLKQKEEQLKRKIEHGELTINEARAKYHLQPIPDETYNEKLKKLD